MLNGFCEQSHCSTPLLFLSTFASFVFFMNLKRRKEKQLEEKTYLFLSFVEKKIEMSG